MGSAGSPGQPPPGCARGVGEGWGASQASLGPAPCLDKGGHHSSSCSGGRAAARLPRSQSHVRMHTHTLTHTHSHTHSHSLLHTQGHVCRHTNFAGPQLPRSSSQMALEPRRDVIDTQGAPKAWGCAWHPSHYLFLLSQSLGWGELDGLRGRP